MVTRRNRMLLTIGMANALVAFVHFGLAAAGPVLRAGLDIGNGGLGWLLASAPAGLMLGTFAWGHLADQIGERRALTIAYSAATVILAAAAFVASRIWSDGPRLAAHPELLVLLCVLLVATGAAGSAAHSAGGRAIVEAFPPHMHSRVLAIRHTFIPLGGTVGGVTMPSLLRATGLGTALAGAAVFALLLAFALARAVPRELPTRLDGEGVALETGPSPLRVPRLWLLGGSCSMLALTQLALVSFLAVFLVDDAGLAAATAGAVFAGSQVIGAVARIAMGDLADRIGDPMLILGAVAAVTLVLLAAALAAPAHLAGFLLAGALLVSTSWNGVAVAAAARLAPDGRTGSTLGMQTTMFATMGVLAPIVVGAVLARASWSPVLAAGIVALAAALVGFTALRRSSGTVRSPAPA